MEEINQYCNHKFTISESKKKVAAIKNVDASISALKQELNGFQDIFAKIGKVESCKDIEKENRKRSQNLEEFKTQLEDISRELDELSQLEGINKEIASIEQAIAIKTKELEKLTETIRSREKDHQSLEKKLINRKQKTLMLEDLEKQVLAVVQKLDGCKKINETFTKIHDFQQESEKIRPAIVKLQEWVGEKERELQDTLTDLSKEIKNEFDDYTGKFQQFCKLMEQTSRLSRNIASTEETQKNLKGIINLYNEIDDLSKQLQQHQEKLGNAKNDLKKLEKIDEEIREKTEEMRKTLEEMKRLKGDLENAREKNKQKREFDEWKEKESHINGEIGKLDENLRQIDARIKDLHQTLELETEDREDYQQLKKRLDKFKEQHENTERKIKEREAFILDREKSIFRTFKAKLEHSLEEWGAGSRRVAWVLLLSSFGVMIAGVSLGLALNPFFMLFLVGAGTLVLLALLIIKGIIKLSGYQKSMREVVALVIHYLENCPIEIPRQISVKQVQSMTTIECHISIIENHIQNLEKLAKKVTVRPSDELVNRLEALFYYRARGDLSFMLHESLEQFKKNHSSEENELREIQEKLINHTSNQDKISKIRGQLELILQRRDDSIKTRDKLHEERVGIIKTLEGFEKDQYPTRLEDLNACIKRMEKSIEDMNTKKAVLESKIKDLQEDRKQLVNQDPSSSITALKTEITEITNRLKQNKNKREYLESIIDPQSRNKDNSQVLKDLEQKLTALRDELAKKKEQARNCQDALLSTCSNFGLDHLLEEETVKCFKILLDEHLDPMTSSILATLATIKEDPLAMRSSWSMLKQDHPLPFLQDDLEKISAKFKAVSDRVNEIKKHQDDLETLEQSIDEARQNIPEEYQDDEASFKNHFSGLKGDLQSKRDKITELKNTLKQEDATSISKERKGLEDEIQKLREEQENLEAAINDLNAISGKKQQSLPMEYKDEKEIEKAKKTLLGKRDYIRQMITQLKTEIKGSKKQLHEQVSELSMMVRELEIASELEGILEEDGMCSFDKISHSIGLLRSKIDGEITAIIGKIQD
ncbi:hypothetical protein GF325_00565, partial [Candidatus Bathyarchaeota archaeon]|nr:hypothetical protein [Candidatus Bathyarchaeota archaeon]